jgi:hypothetical protein
MPALLPIILTASHICSGGRRSTKVQCRADLAAVPAKCLFRSAGSAGDCKRDEEDAHSKLQQDWAQYSPAQRTGCVRFSSLGSSPSYVELLTCLEMAKQAKELPEASKTGTVRAALAIRISCRAAC